MDGRFKALNKLFFSWF